MRNKKYITWMNISMYIRYVSLIIIWKTNKEEQPRQKSIVVGYFWCFLSHRIVIISYYQTCNGFLVQCMYGLRCKNDKLRMHVSTNWYNKCFLFFYIGVCLWLPDFVMKDFKNNSFFTSSEVHLACSERLTFVLV